MKIQGTQTEKNLITAFAGESQARNRYTYFAGQARKEGFMQIAWVFEETADQEKEHAKRLFSLLEGGEAKVEALFPAGKVRRGRFTIGDVLGSPGDSLEIVLSGDKAGLWTDRESGEGGDVFDVVARNQRIDARADFQRLLTYCSELVGRADRTPTRSASRDVLRPSTSWVLPRRNGTIWTPTVS